MRISHSNPDDEDRGLQNVGFKLNLDVANHMRLLCSLKLSPAQRIQIPSLDREPLLFSINTNKI